MKYCTRFFSFVLTLFILFGVITILPFAAYAGETVAIIPSATGGAYDESTNTLTILGGGKVSFAPRGDIEFEYVEGTRQPKDGEDITGDDNISATFDGTKWVATFPNEDAEYIFRGYYYATENQFTSVECTVVVNYGLRTPTNLRWDTSTGTVAVWDAVDGAANYIVELWKKDIISLHLLSHVVSDTSFEFYLTTLSAGSYYFTVRAVTEDIKSNVATSDDIIITSGGTPIVIGGVNVSVDSIDGTAYIVGREDIADGSISEVDLSGASGSTDLVIDQSKIDPNAEKVTVKFDGTQAEMNNDAMQKILDNLGDGDNVRISVKNAGSEVLPDSLTEQGPYGGSDWTIDTSVFKATGIENIEDRLKTLGLINGNTDTTITEEEFEYLYHYLTTDELTALKNELNESAHFEHHQKAVEWLDEMIERDGAAVTLNTGHLDESGIRSKLEAIGYTGTGLTLGLLRQADLDMEQLEYIKNLMQEFIEVFDDEADELILAWAEEAIAQKELETSYAQMDEWIAEADAMGMGAYVAGNPIEEVKQAVQTMTTAELEKFLKKANEAKNYSISMELYDLAAFLSDELEARQAQQDTQDAPTYINVGGTSDGINPIFIGAVDVNIAAVKVDGTTTPVAIKADRSNAVAWSTNISSAALEEILASAGKTATGTTAATAVRAYKVLDNGGLAAKAAKVTVNADGTLTLSAMSDGNSTYIFVLEPNPYTDVNETDWYYNDVMLADQQLLMTGTGDNTFSPDAATSRGMIATILHRMEGSPEMIYSGAMTDVPADAYYANAVKWAAATGVLNGYGDGKFGAEDKITREQLAAILHNYAVYKGCDVSVGEDTNILSYNDFDKISEYAISSVQWACGAGIIGGRDGGMLAPQGEAKRCEVAAMLNRYGNWMEEAK